MCLQDPQSFPVTANASYESACLFGAPLAAQAQMPSQTLELLKREMAQKTQACHHPPSRGKTAPNHLVQDAALDM